MSRVRPPCAFGFALALCLAAAPAGATTILADVVEDPSTGITENDIVQIRGGFDDTSLFLQVDFRSGTMTPDNLVAVFHLDTDLDPATGTSLLGAEFRAAFVSRDDPDQAQVFETGVSQPLGLAPAALGADSLALTVPLALLRDDGVAFFGAEAGSLDDQGFLILNDLTPSDAFNARASFALGGPTTLIPEPATGLLVALGGVALGVARASRKR